MHRRQATPFVAGALAALLAAGCAGALSRRDELMIAVREFNDGVRWGKIDASAARLPIVARQKFAERFAAVEDDLEVVDYDLQRIELVPGGKIAIVRVDVAWSLKRRGIVERTVVEQKWEEALGRIGLGGWTLVRETRLKGSALPIFEIDAVASAAAAAASANAPTPREASPAAEPAPVPAR